jgi:mono/diheme cytochrome c family protein
MKSAYTFLLLILLFSCKTNTKLLGDTLSPANLETQTFEIDKNRDTVLISKAGCKIKIPKGTLVCNDAVVSLQFKEAINIADIVLAGLTTTFNGKPLRSGGMIFLDYDKKQEVTINGKIEVSVPTNNYIAGMKAFDGAVTNDSIKWQNPLPLANDSSSEQNAFGEMLFKAQCNNCHKPYQDYTGPALAGVTLRRGKDWIYRFIKNPAGMIATNDTAHCLFDKWRPIIMTSFPALNNEDIDAILAYVEAEANKDSARAKDFFKDEENERAKYNCEKLVLTCEDSCRLGLIDYRDIDDTTNNILTNIEPIEENKPVANEPAPALATDASTYTVEFYNFGWKNIDILLEETNRAAEISLNVKVNSTNNASKNCYLIIPKQNVFAEGSIDSSTNSFVFNYEKNTLALPTGTLCHVIASQDGKTAWFASNSFATLKNNNITLNLKETNAKKMLLEIKDLTSQNGKKRIIEAIKQMANTDSAVVNKIDSTSRKENLPAGKKGKCDCNNWPEKVPMAFSK